MTLKITADNIDLNTLTSVSGPKITLIDYPGDDLATPPAGGATVVIAGTGFVSGCQVLINTTYANTVTFSNSSSISFTAPALTAGTYPIYVINPDGGTAISIPGISYSGVPAFATGSGSIGSAYETTSFSSTIAATSDSAIAYTIDSGALPAGFSLNANTGAITGNAGSVTNSTTYNFTVKANDAELQDTTRSFSITLNPDVVTFNTPAGNQTYSNVTGNVFSLTLNATSAAGKTVSYTANTLPGGITLSGNLISGTFNSPATVTSLITATAATTLKSATQLLTWAVTSTTVLAEYLVVAGGAGGGISTGAPGGGGGAGGMVTGTASFSFGSTYALTVGAGGGGVSSGQATYGSNGSNSMFNGITCIGGGGGGYYNGLAGAAGRVQGQAGGSGGGGPTDYGSGGGGGAGTTGQGNAGGSADSNAYQYAGGGGGKGAVGGSAIPCNGGIGAEWPAASGTYYAGGGGGGGNADGVTLSQGGTGGGGRGGRGQNAFGVSGTANTGGGGGGSYSLSSGSGGSGVVIIRYTDTNPAATSTTGSPTVTVSGGYRVYKFTSSGSITF